MKIATFLFINFIVAFFSDIFLNDLSTNYQVIPSLKSYFYKQSIIKSGIYAAVTIEVALLVTILLFYLIFGSIFPDNKNKNKNSLLYFCILAFFIGYIMDVMINKMKIFGNKLDLYYKKFGAGFWGASSLLFSILLSYFIQKKILPIL